MRARAADLKDAIVLLTQPQQEFIARDRLQPSEHDSAVRIGAPPFLNPRGPLGNQARARVMREVGAGLTLRPTQGQHGTAFVLGNRNTPPDATPSVILTAEHYNLVVRLVQSGAPVRLRARALLIMEVRWPRGRAEHGGHAARDAPRQIRRGGLRRDVHAQVDAGSGRHGLAVLTPVIAGHKRILVLCHYPLASWDRRHHGAWHLHGHSHGTHQGTGCILDVGVDCHGYAPVAADELPALMEGKADPPRRRDDERVE